MSLFSFATPADVVFSGPSRETIEIKSAVLGISSETCRYFELKLGIDITKPVDVQEFIRIKTFNPCFGGLTLEQFNRLSSLFTAIRNVSAHLFLSKPLFLDRDIKEILISKSRPRYPIIDGREITIYGVAFVLAFFSIKAAIWSFVTAFVNRRLFMEAKKNVAELQRQIQLEFNCVCGKGKPVNQLGRSTGNEQVFADSVLKTNLTSILFETEKATHKMGGTTSFRGMLTDAGLFNGELINNLVWLRNMWMHGTHVGDVVASPSGTAVFGIPLICETLESYLKAIIGKEKFHRVEYAINTFSEKIYDFFTLRITEITFKLLDKRLLREDKIESRIAESTAALGRITDDVKECLMWAEKIRSTTTNTWHLTQSKFEDFRERSTTTDNLKIVCIHSDDGITIGDYKSQQKEVALALVTIDDEYANTVNGKKITDLNINYIEDYSSFISVYESKLQ